VPAAPSQGCAAGATLAVAGIVLIPALSFFRPFAVRCRVLHWFQNENSSELMKYIDTLYRSNINCRCILF
jgi:hypothetical protein